MTRCSLVLLCVALVGCGGTAPSVRHAPDAQRRCVYVPSRDEVARAWKKEVPSARAGVHVVLVAATAGASPVAPPAPSPAPALEGLSGGRLGNGIPRGMLLLVPEGGAGAEAGAGGVAGEAVVVGGAFVAAVGSGLLVCLTVSAAADGAKTPIEIADEYYDTHFGAWSSILLCPSNFRPHWRFSFETATTTWTRMLNRGAPCSAWRRLIDSMSAPPLTIAVDMTTSLIGGFAGESSS